MPFFSNIFKGKDSHTGNNIKENGAITAEALRPRRWDDAWQRNEVEPEEVQELLSIIIHELKSRALDLPFLLLPFRPASDPSAARSFVRNFFNSPADRGYHMAGEVLSQELRLIEPMVLCSVMKWCWSRLPGGVVGWEAYELFKIGEQDSNTARDAFATFIPISASCKAREKIIFDFFDVVAAIAAHGRTNGMAGRKLSRLAGWWAFDPVRVGSTFDDGYLAWNQAADATSHLFFAYLRSLSPDSIAGQNGISALPLSLQALLHNTPYPPGPQIRRSVRTSKVVMVVDTVSPTPFALLRRAKHFEYRDDDKILREFSDYEDPVLALTEECRRVLKCISSANDSSTTKTSTSLGNASWSRFEDIGFGGMGHDSDHDDEVDPTVLQHRKMATGLRTNAQSKTTDLGRPTTPSWADFLSSGFIDDTKQGSGYLLPPDKVLPPIITRGQSSQSHRRMTDDDSLLEPGELANITGLNLDDSFWWVWMSSLSGEETSDRKSAFGRCALIETAFKGSHWLVMEEMVKGAAPDPADGAYIAEKKRRFGFSKRTRLGRSKSSGKKPPKHHEPMPHQPPSVASSRVRIAPDQHARIQAAAAALQHKQNSRQQAPEATSPRRARRDEATSTNTSSVFNPQPVIMSEAASAMKWASSYDKDTIRAQYLGNNFAGKGSPTTMSETAKPAEGTKTNGSATPAPLHKDLPAFPEAPGTPSHIGADPKLVDRTNQGAGTPNPPTIQRKRSEISATQGSKAEAARVLPYISPMGVMADQGKRPFVPGHVSAESPGTEIPHITQEAYPQPMERSAVPPLQQMDGVMAPQDPHSLAAGPDYSKYTNPAPFVPEPSSLESATSAQKKLKKKSGPSGIKGFFGRKKVEPPSEPPSISAVAAARAALEAKQDAVPTPIAPKEVKAGRRISNFGRKAVPPPPPTLLPTPIEEHTTSIISEATPTASPRYSRSENRPTDSQASLSRVDSHEQRQAEREFRTFDQGPLEDAPAYAHDPSARDSLVTDTETVPMSEAEDTDGVAEQTTAPATSAEPENEAVGLQPIQDRWAQIRKNAAERAARLNEEQSSSRHTDRPIGSDEVEASDQETIESRVARIKARVAELTGNMDIQGAARP